MVVAGWLGDTGDGAIIVVVVMGILKWTPKTPNIPLFIWLV